MLCVRKENIRVVAIIVSRKERREREGLISPTVHAGAGEVVSIRYDKRTQRQNGKHIYYIATDYWHASALSCRA